MVARLSNRKREIRVSRWGQIQEHNYSNNIIMNYCHRARLYRQDNRYNLIWVAAHTHRNEHTAAVRTPHIFVIMYNKYLLLYYYYYYYYYFTHVTRNSRSIEMRAVGRNFARCVQSESGGIIFWHRFGNIFLRNTPCTQYTVLFPSSRVQFEGDVSFESEWMGMNLSRGLKREHRYIILMCHVERKLVWKYYYVLKKFDLARSLSGFRRGELRSWWPLSNYFMIMTCNWT